MSDWRRPNRLKNKKKTATPPVSKVVKKTVAPKKASAPKPVVAKDTKPKEVKVAGKNQGKRDYEVGKGKPPVHTQFKPGQSGNPAGKKVGKRNFDTLMDIAIEALACEYVKQYNKRHRTKITIDDVDVESDIFKQLANKARNGDLKAIDSFLDRRHGKAKQPVEIGGTPGKPIGFMEVDLQEQEEWEKQWEELGFVHTKKHGSTRTN